MEIVVDFAAAASSSSRLALHMSIDVSENYFEEYLYCIRIYDFIAVRHTHTHMYTECVTQRSGVLLITPFRLKFDMSPLSKAIILQATSSIVKNY